MYGLPRFCFAESRNDGIILEILRFAQNDKIICVSKSQFVEFASEAKQPSK
ncbi:hypothetical protein ACWIUD_07075 [Helicobacter sp. 23-1044]